MKTQKQRRRVTPFTLIEVVVVIVILVTLASVATPMYMNYIKKSKIATAKTQIKLLDDALQQYKLDVGTYPSDLQGLMENIDQSEKWDGPYIKPRVPLDPWGGEYQYIFPLKTLPLEKDDSLFIEIRHDMKREILPGITDVGIKLSRVSRTQKIATRIQSQEDKQ